MKIVFLDACTVSREDDVDLSGVMALGDWTSYAITAPAETANRIADAEVVISNKVMLDAAAIAAAPNLRLIAVAATGTNNVDFEAAKARGIQVCNVSGYSTHSVAQHVMTLILNLVTNIHRSVVQPEAWPQSPIFTRLDYPIQQLNDLTLGLVGVGNIGSRVGEIAEAFGMKVQCYARSGSKASAHPEWPRVAPDAFFASSDVVSLHCPLTAGTHALINAESLGKMNPGAFLINTGRGELLDEAALLESLNSGHLGGAGLDVLSPEPPRADHPLIKAGLPNLLITPHTAWSSRTARQTLIHGIEANIRAFQETGEATNRVA